MLNKGTFNNIGFNTPGDLIRKLITFTIDALLKKQRLIATITSDVIIKLKDLSIIRSTTSDLLIAGRINKSTTCDLTIAKSGYVERIRLRSYIKTVEDVYLERDSITINRMSKLDLIH